MIVSREVENTVVGIVGSGAMGAGLVEVAARNQLLRARGINAARQLAARLDATLTAEAGHAVVERDDDDGDVGDLP